MANYRGTDDETYNLPGSYGEGPKGEYREGTTPVNKFEIANDFGLCDMHGNVWEWCQDNWHGNYQGAPKDGSAWLTESSSAKVLRGGSWNYYPYVCRSAYRLNFTRVDRFNDIGFRVVRVALNTT